jgi:hypothetical protein
MILQIENPILMKFFQEVLFVVADVVVERECH